MTRLSLLIASTFLTFNASALELAKYPKAFTADKGVSVILAPSSDERQALVQIRGINHALDEVVLLTEIRQRGQQEHDYSTTLDGSRYNLVTQRQAWGGESYQLYLPDSREPLYLGFDEKASKAVKPAELLALYEKQKSDGVQDELARFDREKRQQYHVQRLQELDAQASASCGSKLTTEVDWKGLDETLLKELSISSFCGEVVTQMGNLCASSADFKQQTQTLNTVQCSFGKEMKVREQDGRIVFTTEREAPNQGDFINAFLRNR
ncbi:hypothetical protein [Phytopseudomonas dryadis]|uniref:Uncharacterized protein n=1 Tax=Phytopseudomonas dryadis TaxID=2487520 RepID=A0ABY1Z781_9GAMM|nr:MULTISPECIES: hypothetical protein [Pseudomonas]TBV03254.1 hypothetical protein DNK34_16830 [Pseudomonas dryadis]TBV16372.1 hypothetical protein DNK41_15935 [Pseudomonas sp. FRB 230]